MLMVPLKPYLKFHPRLRLPQLGGGDFRSRIKGRKNASPLNHF
ncbi:hypothetical protein DSW25_09625 [Sulfitobacter donghicola DSW-25 = KCTC 12864 = JCM 14565]|uniref:Uncharacterized protein n=1 Tax=Sulfitobacter donghicola DSW-25 = KCTC 12864 = JCM 14565 TaxID=1300350 RepID=A0A073IJ80_9RHOB|nr:hypothetical protein DSW25_09625 [Sulfitobacter donghicola DSW-25 = KCTC 12864 = JCM 14565]